MLTVPFFLFLLCLGVVNTLDSDFYGSPDGSEEFAEAFTGILTRRIIAKDQPKLGALLSPNFLFNGCGELYNREKTLALFDSVKDNTKVSLDFQKSHWINNNSDIEYSVLATGLGVPSFKTQLILHKGNGYYVLTGGKVPKCVV